VSARIKNIKSIIGWKTGLVCNKKEWIGRKYQKVTANFYSDINLLSYA
jgi:hypothetical protein